MNFVTLGIPKVPIGSPWKALCIKGAPLAVSAAEGYVGERERLEGGHLLLRASNAT